MLFACGCRRNRLRMCCQRRRLPAPIIARRLCCHCEERSDEAIQGPGLLRRCAPRNDSKDVSRLWVPAGVVAGNTFLTGSAYIRMRRACEWCDVMTSHLQLPLVPMAGHGEPAKRASAIAAWLRRQARRAVLLIWWTLTLQLARQ